MKAQGGVGIKLYFFFNSALYGVGDQLHAPASLSIVQEAGWAPGRFGRVRNISPPPGLDPWTVKPLASCYTNDDLPAHKFGGWETQSKEVFSGMEPCSLVEIQRRFVGLGYFSLQGHYITARLNDLKFPSPQKKIFIFHGRTTNLKRKKQSYHCTNYLEELRISRKLLAELTNEKPTWCHSLFYFTIMRPTCFGH
jgi:hypothetical protein